ncbi:hypothetical protein N7495_003903 [Penicillium taxi]|uniref:uncharacterized protein n=1 Tax=Penicillium taxi TaxID=168475 RepID=UPI0025458EE7|nr:uncharacterized protein N7495_003903 [Penicillium taxi]KAJ5899159.1 hypothetical protein N7495_003903 [Penicillium taxi]
MYLLTETAMGDSTHFEILSFEEVEGLKKERTLLSHRIEGTKRKLALETKLRDAAESIGRLYSPPTPRSSGEYRPNGSPVAHRRSHSIFGRSGTAEVLEKSDSELATSQRKCEELAQELWKLEHRSQLINQRLLEHTAGVLQMTHKGLKKAKNSDALDTDAHDFDDRHLYRTPDHIDNYGLNGRIEVANPIDTAALQATERKVAELSERICEMMIQSKPGEFIDPPPQQSDGQDAAVALEAHLAYLENGINNLQSIGPSPSAGYTSETEGPGGNACPILIAGFRGLDEQLAYLQTGIDGLESRVDGVLEQKSILTTQIQQQRELNSKSDAERDAHIGDLTTQLAQVREELGTSQRDCQTAQSELAVMMERVEAMRQDGSSHDEIKATLALSEAEVVRLQGATESLKREVDYHAAQVLEVQSRSEQELQEAHERAGNAAELEASIEKIRSEADARVQEATERHAQMQEHITQIESEYGQAMDQIAQVKSEHGQAMDQIAQVKSEHGQAVEQLTQLESQRAQMEQQITQTESQHAAAVDELAQAESQRAQAEGNANRLQSEMTELEGEVVRLTTELTMVKAELDGAYGTRAQRAAEVAANPEIMKEIDALNTRNLELTMELASLKGQQGGGDFKQRADTLEKELRETLDDYEAMTRASIEFEKERERFEGVIDNLRDRCEHLETQLSEERINWMNTNSPGSVGRDGSETTSTMVLKNEFKKMMRDTRSENVRILKVSLLINFLFFPDVLTIDRPNKRNAGGLKGCCELLERSTRKLQASHYLAL